jgi:signal transduction histidine kinase/ligand-binding sensor domain-containing protein
MINKILFTYFIIVISIIKAGAQELPLTHFTASGNESYSLPSSMVTNIFQDSEGFLWMAVFSSGLVRYDGAKMDIYSSQDGLTDLGVWQILEDGQGHLWISSNAGVVVSEEPVSSYKNGRKLKFTNQLGGVNLSDEGMTENRLAVDNSGKIWVATVTHGLINYHTGPDAQLTVDTVSTNLDGTIDFFVSSVFASKSGTLFAALEGGVLVECEGDTLNILYTPKVISNEQNFNSLFEDEKGRIWAFKQNGELLLFESKRSTPIFISKQPQTNYFGIYSFEEGVIWTSNSESGITRIDEDNFKVLGAYTRANGLLSNHIYDVFQDREGNVWIAQSGGVSKLRFNYKAFENFGAEPNAGEKPILPNPKVNTVLVPEIGSSQCRFWVGTEGGLACVHYDGLSTVLTEADGLFGDWINGMEQDKDGRIWIASIYGLSALVFDQKLIFNDGQNIKEIIIGGKTAYLFTMSDSPPIIASEKLALFSKQLNQDVESLWFPGSRGLYSIVGTNSFLLGEKSGLPQTVYNSVAFDGDGYLWVGTRDKGLYKSTTPITLEKLHENKFNKSIEFGLFWSLENGAPTNNIEKLLWSNGKIWVGTQQGLISLDHKSGNIISTFNTASGLPANNPISFAVSPVDGNFWIGTNLGLTEFDPRQGKVIKTVSQRDGLIGNEVWLFGSVQIDASGQVYFGTDNGISIYHPYFDKINSVPPILQFTAIERPEWSENRNEITFEYAALSFADVSGVRYRTRLIGYEKEWSEPTGIRRLRYTNLPAFFWAKEYTLEVMAINESGVESELPITFSFLIKPMMWLRWWAFLIYLSILILIFLIIDKYQRKKVLKKERDAARLREAELQAETAMARSRAAESESKALQAEVEKKALELEKVEVLEKAYTELKQAQNQLVQAEKLASLGRLATGIAHEIKNPLNFINNFAGVSVELVDELAAAIKAGDMEEVDYLMESLKENTVRIEKHGKRADSIVQSMTQHAKATNATFDLFDLNTLVQNYLEIAYNTKKSKTPDLAVNINWQLQPNLEKVKLYGQQFGQALLNILGNALDAVWDQKIKQGGDYQPELTITTLLVEKHFEILVKDNGPGIPEDIKERIFEPFFTTKPTGQGTGLGLSLSYDIITQSHNGKLELETEVGKGTTFIIHIPLI